MKGKNLGLLAGAVVLIFLIATLAAFGLTPIGKFYIPPVKNMIKLGLDLRGGVSVLLEAKPKKGETITKDKIDRAISIIENRVNGLGVTEPTVSASGTNRVLVEIPGLKDTVQALELIGKTAQLNFVDEKGKVVLTGADVKEAKAELANTDNGLSNQPVISFKLTTDGAKKFAIATKENLGKVISIELDGKVLTAPRVESEIPGGEGIIEGSESLEEAAKTALLIRAGALPIELVQMSVMSVGPQLGANSFEKTVIAGGIGVIIVFIFMIAFYRVPGVIANISLILYTCIVLFILAGFKATLTLPGIAGIILSVGMAVDANILIFERLKEELRLGKTLRAAMDAGFKRAFLTIFDSNLTTIIAAIVLFYFGSGTIKGFALTLIVGVLTSMFTALTVTKFLLKTLIESGLIKNTKLYSR